MNMRNLIPAAAAAFPAAPAILSTVAAVLPPVLVGLAIAGFVSWVIDESKKQQATEPTAPEIPESRPQIPAPNVTRGAVALARPRARRKALCESASRIAAPALNARRVLDLPAPAPAASSLGNSSVPAAAPVSALAAVPVPVVEPTAALFTRKLTADKVAALFASGPLSRGAAVAALVANGASRSRAYEALRADGAFASFLIFQSDGEISWKA